MRGYIRQRSRGTYSIKISTGKDPATGKYTSQWFTVKGNKRDAEKRLSELLHQMDTGNYVKPGKQTLGDFLTQWLNDCHANLAPHTAQSYKFFVERHIKPTLGQIPITQLKPDQLQRFYTEKLTNGRRDGTGGLGSRSV